MRRRAVTGLGPLLGGKISIVRFGEDRLQGAFTCACGFFGTVNGSIFSSNHWFLARNGSQWNQLGSLGPQSPVSYHCLGWPER